MPEKQRKNQAILDFLESLKQQLNDGNPKNFGLYMLLYKRHGKPAMKEALKITLQRGVEQKFRYFLGVLNANAKEQAKREAKAKPEKEVSINQEGLDKYNELKKALLHKLTPKYQRRSRTRTGIYHKLAKEERKKRRNS